MRSLAQAAGISHPRISQLEAGARPIRPNTAKALADALDVDIAVITIPDAPAARAAS